MRLKPPPHRGAGDVARPASNAALVAAPQCGRPVGCLATPQGGSPERGDLVMAPHLPARQPRARERPQRIKCHRSTAIRSTLKRASHQTGASGANVLQVSNCGWTAANYIANGRKGRRCQSGTMLQPDGELAGYLSSYCRTQSAAVGHQLCASGALHEVQLLPSAVNRRCAPALRFKRIACSAATAERNKPPLRTSTALRACRVACSTATARRSKLLSGSSTVI